MKTGTQTRIGVILPKSKYLQSVKLSRQGKLRLTYMDYYKKCGSVALTARRFGVSRVTIHKWLKRYKPGYILSLEDRSKRPKRTRKPTTSHETVSLIKALRIKHPEYSKYKLAVIIKRDYNLKVSATTIGRILKRYDLFWLKPKRKKPANRYRPYLSKTLKPAGLKAEHSHQIYEFDAKHIRTLSGRKLYALATIDIYSKQAYVMVSTSISSKQAALAWQRAVKRLGRPKILITDHGSENLGEFAQSLDRDPTIHYYARVRQPKDKPFIERFIGSLEVECLSNFGTDETVADQQKIIDAWLAKYHYYRPHASLSYLTPFEFAAKMEDNRV